MKIGKWLAVPAASGLVLSLGSCVSNIAYYASDLYSDYLPNLLETLLGTVSETA